jgi:acyl dehydratase
MRQIRYDDLAALREMISSEFGPWGAQLEITQKMIDDFAELTGDHQWLHSDVERARSGPFKGTIAQGLLTLAVLPKIRAPSNFTVIGHGSTVNYGSDGLRFIRPVRAGSRIHAHSRVTQVEAHERGTRITLEISAHVVGEDIPALLFKAVMLHAPPAARPAL